MEELQEIVSKYKKIDVDSELTSFAKMILFSIDFYKDVAEIYDCTTRIKNLSRNPSGFNFNDAAILGLLIRIWKILKELIFYYEKRNGNIISSLDRQILESAVIAKYLLLNNELTIEDYRKCSYKNRLKILESVESKRYFQTPAGVRLKNSILNKLKSEGFTLDSFTEQKRNNWRLSGKSFYDIFITVESKEFYPILYGMTSEGIHGSWNESMDYDLYRNEDGTFSTFPFHQEPDIRFVEFPRKNGHLR